MFTATKSDSIRFTGRWDLTGNTAITTAPGAMIELAYCGKAAILHFDICDNVNPYPHLWITVDDGAKIEVPIERVLRIEATDFGEHIIKIIYKSATETQHRWYQPLIGKISFMGYDADKEGTLPEDNRKIIEFIGDSITEGVLIDAFHNYNPDDQKNRPYQDDSTATYAYLTATALNMKPVIIGYGAVGVTKAGNASVPKAALSYGYNFCDSPAKPYGSDIIVINHGANDRWVSPEVYVSEYTDLLKIVRKINPASKIVVLSPFCSVFVAELAKMVDDFNLQNNDNIAFISSKDWVPEEPIHPLRDGHKIIAEHLVEELKEMFSI